MTRRLERQPDDPARDGEQERPTASPPPHDLLALQRSHGNAAVTRALAREPASPTSLQFTQPAPAPRIGGLGPLAVQAKLPADVEKAVDSFLSDNRNVIQMEVTSGTTSSGIAKNSFFGYLLG